METIGKGAVVVWTLVGLLCVLLVWGGLGAFGLVTLPFVLHQENQIIHASNSYVTTQRMALVTLQAQFLALDTRAAAATDSTLVDALLRQEKGVLTQMRQIASLIPNDVPLDVAALLANRR